jgi:hypothetical protein
MGDSGRKSFRNAGVVENPADLRSGRSRGEMRLLRIEEGMSNVKAESTYVSSLFGLLSRSLGGLVSVAYTMSHRGSTY